MHVEAVLTACGDVRLRVFSTSAQQRTDLTIVVAGLMRPTLMEGAVRTLIAAATVALALLVPRSGFTQILQPAGAPVVYQARFYYPSGPTVFFDGAIMVRIGTFRGLPIYVDPTRDPINVVLVPIGGKLMRPYALTQDDIQADLVVPDPPDFPDPPEPFLEDVTYLKHFSPLMDQYAARFTQPGSASTTPSQSFRRGPASRGIWIEFHGRLWTPVGPGPERSPRLKMIGHYFDFPVFQDAAHGDQIFMPATGGGPLIRYDRRP